MVDMNKLRNKKFLLFIAAAILGVFFFLLRTPGRKEADGNNLRIVSLGPYITENLYLLGMGKNISGLTIHDKPEKRAGKEIIGTLISPNIEKILSLKPDIVIGSMEGNRPESLYRLGELGVKTLVLGELYSFEDICANFLKLGTSLGMEETAQNIVEMHSKSLKGIKKKAKREEKKKVFFMLGFKPLITTGGSTYINEMISFAGGANIFKDEAKKWFSCSIEEVIRRNPDVIVYIGMDREAGIFAERLHNIKAAREGKIYKIDDTVIGSPTPETFVNSVKTLYSLLYEEGKDAAEK